MEGDIPRWTGLVSDLCTLWRETLERSQILRRTKVAIVAAELPGKTVGCSIDSRVEGLLLYYPWICGRRVIDGGVASLGTKFLF